MNIITKKELEDMNHKVIFKAQDTDWMVYEGYLSATDVMPVDGEVFNWDWSINEYDDTDLFSVLDTHDIYSAIKEKCTNIAFSNNVTPVDLIPLKNLLSALILPGEE